MIWVLPRQGLSLDRDRSGNRPDYPMQHEMGKWDAERCLNTIFTMGKDDHDGKTPTRRSGMFVENGSPRPNFPRSGIDIRSQYSFEHFLFFAFLCKCTYISTY